MKTENLTSWKKNWLILLHLRKGTSLLDDIFMDCPGKSCLNRIWTSFSAFSTIIYFCTPSVWNDWGPTWLYIMEMGHNQNLMGGGVVQAPLKYTCCNDHPASKFARKPFNWDYKWLSVGLPPRQEAKVFVLEHSSHAEKQADRFQTPNKQMDLFSFPTFFFRGRDSIWTHTRYRIPIFPSGPKGMTASYAEGWPHVMFTQYQRPT